MRVRLLGTGAADGWPTPFCTCASCEDARRHGVARGPTAALVDDVVLLDAGPGVAGAVARSGVHLRDLRHVVITHAHPDHLDPALLLWLSWNPLPHDLHVWGPPSVLEACRPWLGPESRVVLHLAAPSASLTLGTPAGDWRLRVLAAAHLGTVHDPIAAEAVLLDLTAPRGDRLLYATDTGPLPAETLDALTDADLDIALIEETFGLRTDHGTGHLDLTTFPRALAELRRRGAVTDRTTVAAVHLGHHNPPTVDLDRTLAGWGVVLPRDLDVLDTEADPGVPGGEAVRRGSPHRTLVLGGAGSGKSRFAESLLMSRPEVTYVATPLRDADAAWVDRVARHQARRPSGWQTAETLDVAGAITAAAPGAALLVDAMSTWLAGVLVRDLGPSWGDAPRATVLDAADAAIADLVDALDATRGTIVLVSDEVGLGGHATTPAGRTFADVLGTAHQRVAAACDAVTLIVSGHPVDLRAAR